MLMLLVGLAFGVFFGRTLRYSFESVYDPAHHRLCIGSSAAIRVFDTWWVNVQGRRGWASCDSLQAAFDHVISSECGYAVPASASYSGEPLPDWLQAS